MAIVLVAASLFLIGPGAVAADPGPNGDCDVQEEYVTDASIGDLNSIDPESLVRPGALRLIDCKD